MCGICGIIDWETSAPGDLAAVKRMLWPIRHRGPDELAVYGDECAKLGHARLSIVDLAGGGQPIFNEDGSLCIVFNGEIYNHVELRPELERKGHRFSTHSDTEVILHLYEEYGADCLDHMNGQFAFAIWDRANRTLFMARDRFGIRPLFYTMSRNRLLFASELKSLLAVPGVHAGIDPIGLDQVFTFWGALAPRTAFENIQQLPAAHCMRATQEGMRTERYWDLGFPADGDYDASLTEQDYIEGLREELVRATRLRMRADVPVAAYLSGGLDSSITSAIVQRHTEASLATFSIRFDDAGYDEGAYQDEMVARLGTQHKSTTVAREDIAASFADVLWHTETPMLRTAPVPLFRLSGLVRENAIKVVVTGEGADEILAGYNIFKEAKIRRFWAREPGSKKRPLLLTRIYPYIQRPETGAGKAMWKQFFATGLADTDRPCYSHMIRWRNTSALKRFFTRGFRGRIGDYDGIADYERTLPEGFGAWAPLSQAQYVEMTTFMTAYLLSSQGDRMAAAHGVEARFPFLDHHLAEFASKIPPKYKLRGLQEKYALRKAAKGLVPDTVEHRAKQPYRAPDSTCFSCGEGRDLVDYAVSDKAVRDAGCFEPRMVRRLLDKLRNVGEAGVSARDDMTLLGILSTQLIHRRFIEDLPKSEAIPDDAFRVRAFAGTVDGQQE